MPVSGRLPSLQRIDRHGRGFDVLQLSRSLPGDLSGFSRDFADMLADRGNVLVLAVDHFSQKRPTDAVPEGLASFCMQPPQLRQALTAPSYARPWQSPASASS